MALEVLPETCTMACGLAAPEIQLAAEKPIETAIRIEFVATSSFAVARAICQEKVPRRLQVPSQPLNGNCSSELEIRRQKTYERD